MKRYRFLLFAFLLFLAACNIEKPHLPSWDIDLDVPLLNETYLLADMVDNEYIYIGADNALYLQNSGNLSTPVIGDIEFYPEVAIGPLPIPSGIAVDGMFSANDTVEGYEISYGVIDRGAIKTYFTDVDPAVTSIVISFDGIYTPEGNPFQIVYNGSSNPQITSLAHHRVGIANSNTLLDHIGFTVRATSSKPNGAPVANLQLRIENSFQFSEFQGKLMNYSLLIEDNLESIDIDYPYGIEEAIQLLSARLALSFTNELGFVCEFQGNLLARNDITGATVTIPIKDDEGNNFLIDPAQGGIPETTELILRTGIAPLLQIMPHHIEVIDGVFKLKDGINGGIGVVHTTDQIRGSYTLDAPFNFLLLPHTFLLNEPLELEISAENRDRIQKNGISADLALQIRNMLPIGASATIYVDRDSLFAPDDSTSYAFKRAVSIKSVSEAPGFQNVSFSLSETELQVFAHPKLYFQLAFSFKSNGLPVTITAAPSDYVQVRGKLRARVHIEEDK